jgi:hypothetical protein
MNSESKIRSELKNFRIEVEKALWSDIKKELLGLNLIDYAVPKRQNLECTWLLRLNFSNEITLEFSSLINNVGGWQEVGSINIKVVAQEQLDDAADIFLITKINQFTINDIKLLVDCDNKYYAECGVILINNFGEEIVIACSPELGAVSVKAPFNFGKFNPDIPLKECQIK